MVPLFHAMLAAILGSGGSAAPAQHSRIPVVTYGANALAQAAGATKESTGKSVKEGVKSSKEFPKAALKDASKSALKDAGQGKSQAKSEALKKKKT